MQLLKFFLAALLVVAPATATDAKGMEWLKEKSQEKDVIATGTGLLYKVRFREGASRLSFRRFCIILLFRGSSSQRETLAQIPRLIGLLF
jgi:hypothetical protein